jgi:16S rRNA (cytidine1402-2'-O)-methyltransferase
MPGILYVVATPIGNLEDVTLRALRVLREVSLIAAEDTRRTARLLQHYSISTPTTSLHQHNEYQRGPALLARLQAGESIALVSDAGTPVVSDPGTGLVAAAQAAGVRVEPIPGASAGIAALSASGIPAEQFSFVGFPPPRGRARTDWFAALAGEPRTFIVYEAPHRIRQTLSDLLNALGNRTVAVGRELTKLHESLVVQPISSHLETLGEPRGEFTLVVAPPDRSEVGQSTYTTDGVLREFSHLKDQGQSPRQAIRTLATKYALPSREIYQMVHVGDSPE